MQICLPETVYPSWRPIFEKVRSLFSNDYSCTENGYEVSQGLQTQRDEILVRVPESEQDLRQNPTLQVSLVQRVDVARKVSENEK